jgi:hypothetical protein
MPEGRKVFLILNKTISFGYSFAASVSSAVKNVFCIFVFSSCLPAFLRDFLIFSVLFQRGDGILLG